MSTEILDTQLVQAVGWALLHLLWQATLVAVVLAIALAMLRRQAAAVRYVVACGALVVVTVLPALTFFNAYRSNAYRSEIRLGDAASEQSSRGTPTGSFPLLEHQALSAVETGYGSASPVSSYDTFVNQLEPYLPLLVTLWAVGVLGSSSRLVLAWMKLRRLAFHGAPASPEWQHALARLTRRIRLSRPVRLLESAVVEVPTVIGWLRPVVLLPLSALTGMTRQQLETILAHELAHIRRNDFIVNLFQTAVETLFFYHPAVWWISSRIRIEREHCCDDLAVELCGNPLLYARALTELEQTRFTGPSPALALSGGSLVQRVRRLITDSPRRCSAQWLAGVSILTLVAGLAIAAPLSLLAIRDEQPPVEKQQPRAAATATPAAQPAAETITVVAGSDTAEEDEEFEEWLADAEIEDHHAISQQVAEKVAAAAPAIAMTASEAVDSLTLFRGQLGTLISQHAGTGLAYALATVPQAVQGKQVVVAPKVVKVPKMVVQVGDEGFDFDYDFDFDFDFDYDFDFDFEWNDETPVAVKAEAKARAEKPLNRADLTVDDLIKLKSLGITPAYIEELERAGYRNLTLKEIATLRSAGVTPDVIRQFGSMGLTNLSARDLARLRNAGVDAKYMSDLRSAGYKDLSAADVIRLRNAGVTTEFIAFAKSMGFSLTVKDLVKLKNIGVDKEFVEGLSKNGFAGLSTDELVKWKAVGVTPEFAREMKSTFEKITTEDLIKLRASGVTTDFVRSLREAGLTNLTASQVIRLRNAGVDAEFIKQMKKQGN